MDANIDTDKPYIALVFENPPMGEDVLHILYSLCQGIPEHLTIYLESNITVDGTPLHTLTETFANDHKKYH
jgi:hypothetical protein